MTGDGVFSFPQSSHSASQFIPFPAHDKPGNPRMHQASDSQTGQQSERRQDQDGGEEEDEGVFSPPGADSIVSPPDSASLIEDVEDPGRPVWLQRDRSASRSVSEREQRLREHLAQRIAPLPPPPPPRRHFVSPSSSGGRSTAAPAPAPALGPQHLFLPQAGQHVQVKSFICNPTDSTSIRWEFILLGDVMVIYIAEGRQKETGFKESLVALLEHGEEDLHCQRIIAAVEKRRIDKDTILRTLLFLGFQLLPPQAIPADLQTASGTFLLLAMNLSNSDEEDEENAAPNQM